MTWDVVAATRNRLPGERPVRVAGPFETWAAAMDWIAQFGEWGATPRRLAPADRAKPEPAAALDAAERGTDG